ncbi:MAG: nucleoside triphosphate pyrophosphatase [Acidobacteriota bacterium]|nr:nucleoside triphosphate pyrophosphatase [Acidobacteriota bacterium]
MKPILLATQSKYKIALFETLGLPFETAAPPFEEFIDPTLHPEQLALTLARGKAESLAEDWPHHLIIGADQVLALGDEVLTKPGTVDKTVAQLKRLSGKTHRLHTAFAIIEPDTGRAVEDAVHASISFHGNLSEDYLRKMVEADKSWDCVGGYKFESRGVMLMSRVETQDTNAIVGLPLIALIEALSIWGFFEERFEA